MSLIENKKVHFNYEMLEEYNAGIELFGYEVKSIRNKKGSLDGAHVTIRGGEAFLIGMYIPAFQEKNTPKEYDPNRNRRLLLSKKEILELAGYEGEKGLTIVPISCYNSRKKIKVKLFVAKGKKKQDKRDVIKKREVDRDLRRKLSL